MATHSTRTKDRRGARAIAAAAVALLASGLLAGCVTPVPLGDTTVSLYDADDGRGVFVGQFGPSVPDGGVLQLRVVGAIAGSTFCVSLAPLPSEPPASLVEGDMGTPQRACQLVPVAAGDIDIPLTGFGPGWDEELDGPLEGRWYWAQVTVELPQPMQLPLTGVRGVVLDSVPATEACIVGYAIEYC